MKNMKVSVIVLCYNFENYIETCLLSILNQKTNFDFEILVCDDLSTDNSSTCIQLIAQNYPNIKFYKNNENLGPSKTFENLLYNCSGEYIAYIDGDDYWTNPNKLQIQSDFLDKNLDYQMCYTGYYEKTLDNLFTPNNTLNYWFNNGGAPKTDDYRETLIYRNVVHFGKFFRNKKSLFREYFLEIPILDWPLNFENSLHGKVKYLDFPSGVHRKHSNNMMSKILDDDKNSISKNEKTTEEIVINILKNRFLEDKHILDNINE